MSIRLINTSTLEMKVFTGKGVPTYATLSHTWIYDEEVTFQEMSQIFHDPDHPATQKSGYQKIIMTCRIAHRDMIHYAWVDTCCIDKTSSAELSEAINSMFKWYQRAEICYAFLSDLRPNSEVKATMRDCRWFTRGWCLQELIAPKQINFYDQTWGFVGKRSELKTLISDITGVDRAVLTDCRILYSIPVAERMSWASKRDTTRTEDIAYCLLGIFDISMPMLYGEGDRAFIRLQEEIIKRSNDLSIFWGISTNDDDNSAFDGHAPFKPAANTQLKNTEDFESDSGLESISDYCLTTGYRNVFSHLPSCFIEYSDPDISDPVFSDTDASFNDDIGLPLSRAFSLTNRGVYFQNSELVICTKRCGFYRMPLGHSQDMHLQKVGPSLFVRLEGPGCLHRYEKLIDNEEAYIIATVLPQMRSQLDSCYDYSIQIHSDNVNLGDALQGPVPQERWDASILGFLTQGDGSFEGFVKVYPYMAAEQPRQLDSTEPVYFYLACGIDNGNRCQAWVKLFSSSDWRILQRRIGKMVGLKYGSQRSGRDYTFDEQKFGRTLVQARVLYLKDNRRKNYDRSYPSFRLNLHFKRLNLPERKTDKFGRLDQYRRARA